MNICFLEGKVINKIDLKFIYDIKNKRLGKKHISLVEIELEIKNNQIIKLKGYDEIADFIYRNIREEDYVWVEGKMRNDFVQIEEIIAKC